jgi:hypothetical protein
MRWGQLREVLSNRSIVALSVMGIFLAGAQLSIITHLVLYLKNEYPSFDSGRQAVLRLLSNFEYISYA